MTSIICLIVQGRIMYIIQWPVHFDTVTRFYGIVLYSSIIVVGGNKICDGDWKSKDGIWYYLRHFNQVEYKLHHNFYDKRRQRFLHYSKRNFHRHLLLNQTRFWIYEAKNINQGPFNQLIRLYGTPDSHQLFLLMYLQDQLYSGPNCLNNFVKT